MNTAQYKTLLGKVDQLLAPSISDWVHEKVFSEHTGIEGRNRLWRFRQNYPQLVKKAPGGFIYNLQGWFDSATPYEVGSEKQLR